MNIDTFSQPSSVAMAALGIVFLLMVFWVRRPGRKNPDT
jgi:cbb3-type cytochrome oxidase subunit 3